MTSNGCLSNFEMFISIGKAPISGNLKAFNVYLGLSENQVNFRTFLELANNSGKYAVISYIFIYRIRLHPIAILLNCYFNIAYKL